MHVDRFDLVELSPLALDEYPPVAIYPSLTSSYFELPPPSASQYELITFEQRPNALWTWPLTDSAEPLDWAYTFLDIRVFIDPARTGVDVDALRAALSQN